MSKKVGYFGSPYSSITRGIFEASYCSNFKPTLCLKFEQYEASNNPLVMEEQASRKSVPMWIHVDHRVFEPRNTERTLGISHPGKKAVYQERSSREIPPPVPPE